MCKKFTSEELNIMGSKAKDDIIYQMQDRLDKLEQYHKIARELEGLTNANCFAHARRSYADAIKAMGKGIEELIRGSIAYQALV